MSTDTNAGITQILQEWNRGDETAGERLFPYVYQELKKQARYLMSNERSYHTLQPTALVHEAFLKLSGLNQIEWSDRRHFFRFASRIMRQILVDHARVHGAAKRGNSSIHFSLNDLQIPVAERAASLVELHDALEKLARIDERQATIVEMRYFAGMSAAETAEALDISERTVGREWNEAKLWLFRELNH